MIAQRTVWSIELLKASFQIVIRRKICYIDAAIIGCMDAALGIVIIHKPVIAATLPNLIDLQFIQIVSGLGVLRGNIAAGSKVVLCILLNMTAIVPDVDMRTIYIFHYASLLCTIRGGFNDTFSIPYSKKQLSITIHKT